MHTLSSKDECVAFGSNAFVHCFSLMLSCLHLSSSVQRSWWWRSSTSQLCSPVCNHLMICPGLLAGLPSAHHLLQHLNPAAALLRFSWIFVPVVVIPSPSLTDIPLVLSRLLWTFSCLTACSSAGHPSSSAMLCLTLWISPGSYSDKWVTECNAPLPRVDFLWVWTLLETFGII